MNYSPLEIEYNEAFKMFIAFKLRTQKRLDYNIIMRMCGDFYKCKCINKSQTPSIEIYDNYNGEASYRYGKPLNKVTIISIDMPSDLANKFLLTENLNNSRNYTHYGFDGKNSIFSAKEGFIFFMKYYLKKIIINILIYIVIL